MFTQCNLTVMLCVVESAHLPLMNKLIIIRGLRGEREKSGIASYYVFGGDFTSPPNVQPTQPITQKRGGVSIRQTKHRNVPFLLVLHLQFFMS